MALQSTENIHEIERERERSAFARTKSKAAAGGCQCGVGRNPAPHHRLTDMSRGKNLATHYGAISQPFVFEENII